MEVKRKFEIKDNNDTLLAAIEKVGSQAELARQLQASAEVRCYSQKINEWRLRGVVPPYWVKHLAKIMRVKPKEIDPLLYD